MRPIGAGATGTVWAARHELLGREVALKVATVRGRDAREARDLFLREVQIVGRLRHPNIVDIADAGEAGGDALYLAMELLAGESLAQRIARGPFAPAEALDVAAEVCRGLAAAHAAGVVHRDVKPENVFLAIGPSGGVVPKLLDFGVSSASGIATIHHSRPFGTPAYMSPEQANGARVADPRADLWALGVVLYEMLTATIPFAAPTYPALLPLIIEAPYPPLPPSTPGEVRTVVAGCLAKDRSDRYPPADALHEAIDRARAALPRLRALLRAIRLLRRDAPQRPPLRAGLRHARRHVGFVRRVRRAPRARTARFGLAIAILALPVAVGIAALARTLRAPSPAAARLASDAPAPPLPAPPVIEPGPCVSASAPEPELALSTPAPSASAAPDPSAKPARRPGPAGRPPRSKPSSLVILGP